MHVHVLCWICLAFFLTVSLWGVLAEFDNLSWTPEIQARFPEYSNPDVAFVTPRLGPREPYSDLYMYLLMQTISRWPSVKAILPSAAELNKGRERAATQCKLLLGCQYSAAFSPENGISTMTLLDSNLYLDEEWIAAQVSQFHTILIYSDQIGMKILNKV